MKVETPNSVTSEFLTAGAWGLHLSSFIVASIPYLQAVSLLLAIGVSVFTLCKLLKDSKQRKKSKSNEEVD